jgi:hypothetical protein
MSLIELAREPAQAGTAVFMGDLDTLALTVHRRAGWAFWLLVAFSCVALLPIVAGVVLGVALASAAPGTQDALMVSLERAELTARIVAFGAAGVAFLAWKHAAYRLLPGLTGRETDRAAGWAIGGYFVPFLNFFRPYSIMAEIWDESDPERRILALDDRGGRWVLPAWWALWIGGYVAGRVAAQSDAVLLNVVSVVAFALAGVFAALLVRAVDDKQQSRAAEVLAGEGILAPSSNN